MAIFRDPEHSLLRHVSTGSAEDRHSRAGMGGMAIIPSAAGHIGRSARRGGRHDWAGSPARSEEHTSELQSLMRISYAVFCLKKKKNNKTQEHIVITTIDKKLMKMTIIISTHNIL